jgi:hypothetical protein
MTRTTGFFAAAMRRIDGRPGASGRGPGIDAAPFVSFFDVLRLPLLFFTVF